MKHEWRKKEKSIYLPKNKPEIILVAEYNFITIDGEGNPNNESFGDYITALYAIAYTIKMTLKKEENVKGYNDYTVYPLEGVWDINEKAKIENSVVLNKDDLFFKLMIRQPDFVDKHIFEKMKNVAISKKKISLLTDVYFEKITEGKSVQMMHLGSYDNEPVSFAQMEKFAIANNLKRVSKMHREIYISDFQKVAVEKIKTVLRFNVK